MFTAVRVLPLIANLMNHVLSLVNISLFAILHAFFTVKLHSANFYRIKVIIFSVSVQAVFSAQGLP
jgi:hypothetical protein